MQVSKFLNKDVGSSEAEVFRLMGSVDTLMVSIDNQDGANTMLYKFQDSDDGITWDDIEIPISGGASQIQISLPAGNLHALKLTVSKARLRLMASGDLHVGLGLQYNIGSPTDETAYEIFPT